METATITPQTQQKVETRSIGPLMEVALDIAAHRIVMVNVAFIGRPGSDDWVLVDAGLQFSAPSILRAAAERFGPQSRPKAIILTHAHFDHVGALKTLAKTWDVPVYAHALELPYITGRSAYPPPDPTVGGGMMARLSPAYPRGPWNIGRRAQPLPADGSVPHMPGWRWVDASGHSPGQVAFFRDSDRALIAGDAFVTTKQESLMAVLAQTPEIHGPPAYYTTDWDAARQSVQILAALEPRLVATGHGKPLFGLAMLASLRNLARDFDRLAIPQTGRYVHHPAVTDARGVVSVPPAVPMPTRTLLLSLGAGFATGLALQSLFPRRRS